MRWNIKQVAEAKGYKNALAVADATGIPLASMYKLWNGTSKMVAVETLDKLCKLLNVPVGMLLEYVPDELLGSRSASEQGMAANKSRRTRAKGESRQARRSKRTAALAVG